MERGIRRTYTWFYLPDDVFSNLTSKPMNRPVKFFLHNVNAATRTGNCNLFLRSSEPGGARRDRTDDLMLAKHALYQLSYGPSATSIGLHLTSWAGRPGQTRTADLTLIRRTL